MFTESSENEKKECEHRLRQLKKREDNGRLVILVRCRRCQRSAVEIYATKANSKSVFISKEIEWLD